MLGSPTLLEVAFHKGVHTLVVASRGEVASHMEGGALVVGIHKWVVSQLGDAHRRSVASNWLARW